MVNPQIIIDSIADAVESDPDVPDLEAYLTQPVDLVGEDAEVPTPFLEVRPVTKIRSDTNSNNVVDFIYDDNGNHIGNIHAALFTMELQLDVWGVSGTPYNVMDIGYELERSLFEYDTAVYGTFLTDSNGDDIDDIVEFTVMEGERDDRLMGDPLDQRTSPSIRRWRLRIDVEFEDLINTLEEYGEFPYVKNVIYPADGDFRPGTTENIAIEYTPP